MSVNVENETSALLARAYQQVSFECNRAVLQGSFGMHTWRAKKRAAGAKLAAAPAVRERETERYVCVRDRERQTDR